MPDTKGSCPIWGPEYKATVTQNALVEISKVDSDRAGGKYEITIVWTDEQVLREKLKNRILAVIGEGSKAQKTPGG